MWPCERMSRWRASGEPFSFARTMSDSWSVNHQFSWNGLAIGITGFVRSASWNDAFDRSIPQDDHAHRRSPAWDGRRSEQVVDA